MSRTAKSHHLLRRLGRRRRRDRGARWPRAWPRPTCSDAYRRVVRRGHPAPRRHRLHLGARPAPLLQARQGLRVHVRRRDLASRASGSAGQSLAAVSPGTTRQPRVAERVRGTIRQVDPSRGCRSRPRTGRSSSSPTTRRSRTSRARWRAPRGELDRSVLALRSWARKSRAGRLSDAGTSLAGPSEDLQRPWARREWAGSPHKLQQLAGRHPRLYRAAPPRRAQGLRDPPPAHDRARRGPGSVDHRAAAAGVRVAPAARRRSAPWGCPRSSRKRSI